ncbi:RnfABCDGE type electron transport complex subunit B [Uliginosibacterium paludis]|uniref:Ion-translocating oxidoreductase complex subunit B n=1 Tax=Uliginosibacterium paludis TaxID=1615952 RepID=A0ABV2CLH9_9RHOO
MLTAVISLAAIGSGLGLALGFASRKFHVEGNSIVAEIQAMLPAANCGQCGFPGCAGAAEAIVAGTAAPTCCPPGGKLVAQNIADHLGITLAAGDDMRPVIACVHNHLCIGCTKCIKFCPSDAIIGATKQLHAVMEEACTGCRQCSEKCPTGAIEMMELPQSIQNWVMPQPTQYS